MGMRLLGLILAYAYASTLAAQTPLFLSVQQTDSGGSLPPTANAYYDVEIDFAALKYAPDELLIDLPNGDSVVAFKTHFLYRAGYAYRTEWDPPGTPPVYPIPGAPPDSFSYRWVGGNGEYDVALTVIEGRMMGLITGPKRYGIRQISSGSYRMTDIHSAGFAECAIGTPPQSYQRKNTVRRPSDLSFSMIREVAQPKRFAPLQGLSTVQVDLLVPWTEQARIDAGGSPSDPNDTTELYDLIQTAVDNAQTAFQNSLTNVLVTRYVTTKITGFTHTGDPYGDLTALSIHPATAALRDDTYTDIVVMLTQDSGTAFPACGIARVQTHPGCSSNPIPGCGVGSAFNAHAYALVAADCAVWNDSFTHETGHLMGGNHTRGQVSTAWLNAIIANGYPDAFGKIVPYTFASIMSVDFSTPRRLYFSNPNVVVNGVTTGDLGTANNAHIVDILAPAMEHYRERPDLIFANGFE